MPQIAQVDARVPIELVDLIAFHLRPADGLTNLSPSLKKLQDGLAGLRACSLVCHQWRAIVLPHLFFSITCKFLPEHGLDEQPVGRRRPYKTVSLFCRFLETTPTVRESIHQLLLVPHRSRRINSPTDGEHELDTRLFARLLRLCPRLAVLHLHGVKFLHAVSPSTLDIPWQSRALKTLKIMPCDEGITNPQQLDPSGAWYTVGADVAALAFFSSIDYLHILAPVHGTLPVVPEREPRPSARPPPLTVRHLEVENAGQGLRALVAALERCGAVQTITALTMTRCVRRPTHPVSPELIRLVALLSPTLEQVSVRRMSHDRESTCRLPTCTIPPFELTRRASARRAGRPGSDALHAAARAARRIRLGRSRRIERRCRPAAHRPAASAARPSRRAHDTAEEVV